MPCVNWEGAHAYFEKTTNYILDEPDSQDICFQADKDKLRLCCNFLCGNASGGRYVFQDNGDTGEMKSKFQEWLSRYPDYVKTIPMGVLVNLLHILAKKRDKHGEVAFSPSERDWYDTHQSFEEVRNFAKSELAKMGTPRFSIDEFEWLA